MAKQKKNQNPQLVHCRYKNCSKIHVSNELSKDDAYWDGNGKYYHPDCYHVMKTVIKIRDTFYKEINPLLTASQFKVLVETINNIVFSKNVDVDLLLFAVEYFIKYKPGKLKHPVGLHYIIQDNDVNNAWAKLHKDKVRRETKEALENSINSNDVDIWNIDIRQSQQCYGSGRSQQ